MGMNVRFETKPRTGLPIPAKFNSELSFLVTKTNQYLTISNKSAQPTSMTGQPSLNKSLRLCGILMTMVLAGGCVNLGQEIFREGRDLQVGRSIATWEKLPHSKRQLADGKSEYEFTEKSGCTWAFTVNAQGTIESWRYISDPSLCTQRAALVHY